MQKRDFETNQKRFQDFEISQKFPRPTTVFSRYHSPPLCLFASIRTSFFFLLSLILAYLPLAFMLDADLVCQRT